MNGNQQVLRTLEVRLQKSTPAVLAAPLPYNLFGETQANPSPPPDTGMMLNWSHDGGNTVLGFRIYRNSGSGFILIAAEDQLNNLARQYFDLSASSCMTYYVVAVYQNANGQFRETNPSNYWPSPCP
jgi:hypothetical protein